MRNRNTTSETKTYNHEYAVRRAVQFDKDVLFDLTIDDFTIYGCRVVEGKNGDFISLPSRKGKDGKYWGIVYKRFSQDETSLILDMVSAALAEQDLPF
ncbi:MAG: SpoVG [Bacteriophage sp.]|nr:MAG: SpoVG [Bacteriophage sp.]